MEEQLNNRKSGYKASDLTEATGLSYRQINDWDSKGALPNQREGESGWRRFNEKEIFFMAVCAALRTELGVPIDNFLPLRNYFLQEKANHFKYVAEMVGTFGLTIYLLTDLKQNFIVGSDLEIEDLFKMSFFRGDSKGSYILLKLNPILNQLLTLSKLPPLKTNDEFYKQRASIRNDAELQRLHTDKELEVLKMIRNHDFQKIVIYTEKGEVIQVDTEENISLDEAKQKHKQIQEIIESKKYQTVTIQMHDGKISRLSRKSPIKFSKRQ